MMRSIALLINLLWTDSIHSRRRPTLMSQSFVALNPILALTLSWSLLPALPSPAENTLVVAVATVIREDISRSVAFDAELRPHQEIELHAKVTGYLDSLKVDAGDSVQEGQLIATLDVPELKIEIEHALATERRSHAEIERAKAAYEEANLQFTRLMATDKAQPHLIAQQDLDAARARNRSGEASLDAAKEQANVSEADVKKLRAMLVYTQITAPFAGVITKRYSDAGALIQAGTSSGAQPVVKLSQNDKLRLVFPVSMTYVGRIKVGNAVEVRIESMNRVVSGKVARFSRKVETATRTMETEVDLSNDDLSLIPGMYASVSLDLEKHEKALVAPVEAVTRNKSGKASVYLIGKNNSIEEREVTLGMETPTKLEILSGLAENDVLFVGSRAQVKPGEIVTPMVVKPLKALETVKAK